MKKDVQSTYEREIQDTLDRLGRENGHILMFSRFLTCAREWFDRKTGPVRRPPVVVLGPGIPEELLLAAGAVPYFILGGSLRSTDWSDALVPRDTDPVSRSMLGFLNEPDGPDYSGTLFIVPCAGDSLRKIAWMLEQKGCLVHVVDVPPERTDPFAVLKWEEQMIRLMQTVSKHTHTRVTSGRLKKASRQVASAEAALRDFLRITDGRKDLLTGSAKLLIQNSYYYAEDLAAWTSRLQLLNKELKMRPPGREKENASAPRVLLLGSPVLFPNYKIPFLIEDVGMELIRTMDHTTLKLREDPSYGREKKGRIARIVSAADRWYGRDTSSAYVCNEVLLRSVREFLESEKPEGAVYHVLKGQIEYDFELERLEELFDQYAVPVFRLETDYQYQDLEQLRVRLEAFCEMLTQRHYREERMAR